jgi:hypothetical protein
VLRTCRAAVRCSVLRGSTRSRRSVHVSKRNRSTPPRHVHGRPDNVTAPNRGRLVMATALAAVVTVGGLVYVTQVESGGNALATGSSARSARQRLRLRVRQRDVPGLDQPQGLGDAQRAPDARLHRQPHRRRHRARHDRARPGPQHRQRPHLSPPGTPSDAASSPRQRHRQRLSPPSGARMRA